MKIETNVTFYLHLI